MRIDRFLGRRGIEIEDFERRRVRPSPPRRCDRHLQNCCCRQHRHAFDRMISDPGQHLLVDMIEPTWWRAALTEPEKRVVKGRTDKIESLGRCGEPKLFPVPGVERKPARISWAVE